MCKFLLPKIINVTFLNFNCYLLVLLHFPDLPKSLNLILAHKVFSWLPFKELLFVSFLTVLTSGEIWSLEKAISSIINYVLLFDSLFKEPFFILQTARKPSSTGMEQFNDVLHAGQVHFIHWYLLVSWQAMHGWNYILTSNHRFSFQNISISLVQTIAIFKRKNINKT